MITWITNEGERAKESEVRIKKNSEEEETYPDARYCSEAGAREQPPWSLSWTKKCSLMLGFPLTSSNPPVGDALRYSVRPPLTGLEMLKHTNPSSTCERESEVRMEKESEEEKTYPGPNLEQGGSGRERM